MRLPSRLCGRSVMVGVTITAICFVAPQASAADDYPYKGSDTSGVDPWGFYYRQCASFVAFRMNQRGSFENRMTGPNGTRGDWINATNWDETARRIGFVVDTSPARGAIAQWNGNEGGAHDLGHVAFVDEVLADGSVFVEEYHWTNPYGFSRRGPLRAPRYIHVYDDAPSRLAQPEASRASTPEPVPVPEVETPAVPTQRPVARATPDAVQTRSVDVVTGGEVRPMEVAPSPATPAAIDRIAIVSPAAVTTGSLWWGVVAAAIGCLLVVGLLRRRRARDRADSSERPSDRETARLVGASRR